MNLIIVLEHSNFKSCKVGSSVTLQVCQALWAVHAELVCCAAAKLFWAVVLLVSKPHGTAAV